MPFFKWIIRSRDQQCGKDVLRKNGSSLFSEESCHRELVRAIRELSKLLSVADDIFTNVENDCRTVQSRTDNLKLKILNCHKIVENLNAKTVTVPVSSLTDSSQPNAAGVFKSRQHFEIGHLSADERPTCVRYLYSQAHGPSPILSPQLLTSDRFETTDGHSASALARLEPSSNFVNRCVFADISYDGIRAVSSCDSKSSISNKDSSDVESQRLDSTLPVHSAVVPIDTSGQTFHRMTTLRRSLIHVDFLIRKKKKKDKRRNTVADIESSVLNGHPQPVDNSKQRLSVPCALSESEEQLDTCKIRNTKSENVIAETQKAPSIICSSPEENNNTKPFVDTNDNLSSKNELNARVSIEETNLNYRNISKKTFVKSKSRHEENSSSNGIPKQSAEWAKRIKESAEIKKKTRTNIPISTVSAAMTVAVKMRQTSGFSNSEDAQSSSGNWSGSNSSGRASSDSDDIKMSLKDKVSSSKDSLLSEGSPSYDSKKPQDADINKFSKNELKQQVPVSTNAKSRQSSFKNEKPKIIAKNNDYSFDSDDDQSVSSYYGCNNVYTSSTSISTGSNESLNSLLSRTATELSLSTETLTSESKLPLPPPPPPPPRVSSVKPSNQEVRVTHNTMDIYSKTYPSSNKLKKKESKPINNNNNKIAIQPKQIVKTNVNKKPNEETKSARSTFSTLLQKKFKLKESQPEKLKHQSPKKMQKNSSNRCIDMYGGQASQKVTILVNGNKMPSPEKPKVQFQSFLPKHTSHKEIQSFNRHSDVNGMYIMDNNSTYTSSRASSRAECTSPTNSEVFSDSAVESSEEMNIPLKYAPQITVMPVRRQSDSYHSASSMGFPKNAESNSYPKYYQTNPTMSNSCKCCTPQNFDSYHHNAQLNSSNPVSQVPFNSNMHRNCNAAHVIFDTNGHVIHSTSSLDRRLYKKNHIYSEPPPLSEDSYAARCSNYNNQDTYHRNVSFSPRNQQDFSQSRLCSEVQAMDISKSHGNYYVSYDQIDNQETSYAASNQYSCTSQNDNGQDSLNYNSLPLRGKANQTYDNGNHYQACNNFTNATYRTPQSHSAYNAENFSSVAKPSLLTHENVSQHSRDMNASDIPSCSLNDRPLSEGHYELRSPSNSIKSNNTLYDGEKMQPMTMTAEDLFAIIHDSKKRLNIKTESDISPTPSSSRSNSPSFFRQVSTPSKNGLAETGFLSPRGSYPLTSRDRRSWADFRSAPERKSLASDRMGPSKPTSLHEFKMLLLQTRSNTRSNNERKSAVEQLKATSPNRSVELLDTATTNTSTNMPQQSPSLPLQPSLPYSIYDGHLTVPLKRSHRNRGTIPPRYVMYPPILEDCSEEMENCSETTHDNSFKHHTVATDDNKNWSLGNCTTFKPGHHPQSESKVRFGNSSMWV